MNEDSLKTQRVILEKLHYGMEQRINRRIWEDVIATTDMDFILGDIIIRFEKELVGEKVGEGDVDVPIRMPKSWWQMLKRDYFPDWYVRRWPVKTYDHTVRIAWDELAVFPEHNIKTPKSARGSTTLHYYRQKPPDA